jgi:hypothetical protein
VRAWVPKIGLCLLAAALSGEGIVDDSLGTDLPVSQSGGMPTTPTEAEPCFAFADAGGMLWAPRSEEVSIQQLSSDGGAADGGAPEALVTGPCAPIAKRILHRRSYLLALEQEANQVGWASAPHDYCQLHPDEVECRRPPTAVEQDVDDLVVDPNGPKADADAWVVRWKRELAACQGATPRPPKRK